MQFLKGPLKQAWHLLVEPKAGFLALEKKTFESRVSDYLLLLVAAAFMAGIVSLLFGIGKSAYFDLFYTIDIDYFRMVNYALGRSTSLGFFFIFAGTFLLFLISVILKPFFPKVKFTPFLGIVIASVTPLLLFGWIPVFPFALFIWTIFLFVIGIRTITTKASPKKDSIAQRD